MSKYRWKGVQRAAGDCAADGRQLDVSKIAAMGEDEFVTVCSERPAIHRFPAMAKRIRQVCQVLTDDYDGQAAKTRQ